MIFDGRNLYDPRAHGPQGLRLLRHRPRPRRAAGGGRCPSPPPPEGCTSSSPALPDSSASMWPRGSWPRASASSGVDNLNALLRSRPEAGAPGGTVARGSGLRLPAGRPGRRRCGGGPLRRTCPASISSSTWPPRPGCATRSRTRRLRALQPASASSTCSNPAARRYKPLVYASSSARSTAPTADALLERHNVDHPISLYAATKKANELMAHTYSHLFRLPTTGLRFFTVYGPWGRPDMSPISSPAHPRRASRSTCSTMASMRATSPMSTTSSRGVVRVSDRPRRRIRLGSARSRPGDVHRALPHLQYRQQRAGAALEADRGDGSGHRQEGDQELHADPARRRAGDGFADIDAAGAGGRTGARRRRSRKGWRASWTGTATITAWRRRPPAPDTSRAPRIAELPARFGKGRFSDLEVRGGAPGTGHDCAGTDRALSLSKGGIMSAASSDATGRALC